MSTDIAREELSNCFDQDPRLLLGGQKLPVAFFQWRSEFVYVTEPKNDLPIANILYSHGLTDHAARHFPTAKCLAEAGFRVIQFDLRGHGGQGQAIEQTLPIKQAYASSESASQVLEKLKELRVHPFPDNQFRSKRYRILQATRFGEHLDQFNAIAAQIRQSERFGVDALPLYLLGHSLGALIGAESAWRWCDERTSGGIAGLVTFNPAFRPRARPGNLLEKIAIDSFWLSRSAPRWLLPVSIPRFGFKSLFDLDFAIPTDWGIPYLSEQREESNLYEADPLTLDAVPSRYVRSISNQMEKTDRRSTPFPHDLLTILPGRDGITSVQGGLNFARKPCTGTNSLVRLDDTYAHDLMRSASRSKAREAITSWLGDRVNSSRT